MYEGKTVEALEKNFKKIVDEYLETCATSGKTL
jgi:predicted HicB family RNase H-like nuclease